jgi:hypothetical protein
VRSRGKTHQPDGLVRPLSAVLALSGSFLRLGLYGARERLVTRLRLQRASRSRELIQRRVANPVNRNLSSASGAIATGVTFAPGLAAAAETPAELYNWGPQMMWGWGGTG